MGVLDIKLFRDLIRLWAQALAVALVMACGVATLILAVGVHRSLEETRATYYERYRFGDMFASAVRAPKSLAATIAEIDGVAANEPRIVQPVLLDIEGLREPATGQLISLPADGYAAVNGLFLRQGRLPEAGRSNEVAVNADFAAAHGFAPGSQLSAIVDGSKIRLTIVGIVYSPEFVYALGPGAMMPDNRRFGVFWLPEKTAAALVDLEGAFNSISLRILPGANEDAIIERLDDLLAPYGGTGAIARKDQQSNAFLDGELTQLGAMAQVIPPIFLLISAFLINMILSRLIALEREQIGLLKALGYGRLSVVAHYLKLVLAIAALGVLIGSVAGTWLGHGMTVLYAEFFSFPFLIFLTSPDIYIIAAGVTGLAAIIGGLQAIRTAFSLPAAIAMRPPAPIVYRQLFKDGFFTRITFFTQLTIMAVRHLLRHPVRSFLTAFGVSFAVALLSLGLGVLASMESMVEIAFFRAERQDATLNFSSPRAPDALAAVEKLPGVMQAEPFLVAPVRLTHGQYSRQLAITGKPRSADLSRVLDLELTPVHLPETGLALGDRVGDILNVRRGDIVEVEFLDGLRRVVDVPVTDIIQSYLGLSVFMDIDALARLAGAGPRISGANLLIDTAEIDALYRSLKETPQAGAIALQTIARQRFQETMQESLVLMLTVYVTLAVIIAFGVVYNSARIQLSERARELATLRVLGFGRREVSNVLFIEIGAIVALAQPIGWLIGGYMFYAIIESLATDMFRIPVVFEARTFAVSSLVVVAAALVSALIVRRRIDRLDLVRVLKSRE
jgi:putative ABC transport system permease protein